MVKLSYSDKQLVLGATTDSDKRTIHQPLHKLYFKSSLGGKLYGDSYVWSDIQRDEIASTIERIINHLDRYGIAVSLNDECKDFLNRKRENDKAFLDLMKRGSETKKDTSVDNRNHVSALLTSGFRRTLKDFQLDAVHHLLVVNNGANYSVPGSGKTSIALAYYFILLKEDKIDGLFIIGPASCFEPWEHEYSECFGTKPSSIRIAGMSKIRRNELYLLAD